VQKTVLNALSMILLTIGTSNIVANPCEDPEYWKLKSKSNVTKKDSRRIKKLERACDDYMVSVGSKATTENDSSRKKLSISLKKLERPFSGGYFAVGMGSSLTSFSPVIENRSYDLKNNAMNLNVNLGGIAHNVCFGVSWDFKGSLRPHKIDYDGYIEFDSDSIWNTPFYVAYGTTMLTVGYLLPLDFTINSGIGFGRLIAHSKNAFHYNHQETCFAYQFVLRKIFYFNPLGINIGTSFCGYALDPHDIIVSMFAEFSILRFHK
jgi:hypothetical protein